MERGQIEPGRPSESDSRKREWRVDLDELEASYFPKHEYFVRRPKAGPTPRRSFINEDDTTMHEVEKSMLRSALADSERQSHRHEVERWKARALAAEAELAAMYQQRVDALRGRSKGSD